MADVIRAAASVDSPRRGLESDAVIAQLLELARTRTGMDVAWLSRFRDGRQVFEHLAGPAEAYGLASGGSRALADSYCALVVDGRLPNLVTDARRDRIARDLSMTRDLGLGAYLGAPVLGADGEALGTIACVHRASVYDVGPAEVRFLELLATAAGELLGSDQIVLDRQRRVRDRVGAMLEPGLLTTAFQPIVDITTNRVVGAEALTRFPGEPHEPDRWFADAHSVGLGSALELAAVRQAFAALDELPDDVYLSVNTSPQLLTSPELLQLVCSLPGDRIIVELTEHAAVSDYDEVLRAIEALREHGVRFAVDDVGAGFASFSHVLRIRPDILKIDVSITRGIDQDPARRGLARAIVDLAHEIGATVVAEGIEGQAELDRVVAIGVDAAQGFFVGRPRALPLATRVPRAAIPSTDGDPRVESEQDARRLAEMRFELALLHSPIGIAVVGLDGTFLHTNPALDAMFGYPEAELRRLTFQDITHPEDLAADLELMEECLAGARDGYQMEKRYRRSDGTILPGLLSVVLVRNSDGRPLYFISQIQSLEPGIRGRTRRGPRRSRRRLEPPRAGGAVSTALDELADAIVLLDLDGAIEGWNRAAERLYGWAAQDVIGRDLSLIVPPEGMDELRGLLERARAGERVDRLAVRKHRDGRRLAVLLAVAPRRAPDGAIIGTYSMTRSLHERAMLLGAAIEAEVRLRAPSPLESEATLVTTEHGIARYVSQSIRAVLGYEPDALVDEDLTRYVHAEDISRAVLTFDEAISDPSRPRLVHLRIRDASGVWQPVEVTVVSMLEQPVIDGVALRVRRLESKA